MEDENALEVSNFLLLKDVAAPDESFSEEWSTQQLLIKRDYSCIKIEFSYASYRLIFSILISIHFSHTGSRISKINT